jgi:hypothetical protein
MFMGAMVKIFSRGESDGILNFTRCQLAEWDGKFHLSPNENIHYLFYMTPK